MAVSDLDLVGKNEIGEMLGWSTAKVSVYESRGVLPEQYAYAVAP